MTLIDEVQVKVYAWFLNPFIASRAYVLNDPSAILNSPALPLLRLLAPTVDQYLIDITCNVEQINIRRGKSKPGESFNPGTCTLALESSDNRFDPLATSGTYVVNGRQLWRRGVPIVVCVEGKGALVPTTTRWPLWSGWLDSTDVQRGVVGDIRRATAKCTDAFDRLGRFDQNALDSNVGQGDAATDRIHRWCRLAGVMGINEGPNSFAVFGPNLEKRYGVLNFNLGPGSLSGLQTTDMSENALTAVKAATASSIFNAGAGLDPNHLLEVFVRADGQIALQGGPDLSIPDWIISNDPAPVDPYVGNPGLFALVPYGSPTHEGQPEIQVVEEAYRSVARFTTKGGLTQTAATGDAESYVTQERTDLIATSDTTVATIARKYVDRYGRDFRGGGPVAARFRLRPGVDDGAMAFTSAELLSQVQTSFGQGRLLSIEHDIKPLGDWSMTVEVCEVA